MEDREYITEEQLKDILIDLSPSEIVSYAYHKWTRCENSGYTILDIKNGEVKGLSVGFNKLPLDINYITLYSIESQENPIKDKELFSDEEYEEYLNFKDSNNDISEFCQMKGINEDERKIAILADRFEEDQYFNYEKWENYILNQYYDKIQQENPYKD